MVGAQIITTSEQKSVEPAKVVGIEEPVIDSNGGGPLLSKDALILEPAGIMEVCSLDKNILRVGDVSSKTLNYFEEVAKWVLEKRRMLLLVFCQII